MPWKGYFLNNLLARYLLLNLSLFFIGSVNATTLANLYEVSVPVFSQSNKERKEATTKAFEELLIRVTGKRDVLSLESSQKLLTNSRRFVRSFRYEEIPTSEVLRQQQNKVSEVSDANQSTDEIEDEQEQSQPAQQIVVSFDEKAVKNSLWKSQLPVWGKTRPNTLLWLAVQDHEHRKMLDASEATEILALLKQQAEKRGVPLTFPNLDLEDQVKINVTDVWGAYKIPIDDASSRYQAEAVVSAQLFLDDAGMWQTRWHLYQSGDESSWTFSAPHLNVVIYESIDQLAGALAERYAQVSSGQDDSRFLIHISDVSNLADYEKINRYLNTLSVVKRAELTQIQNDELIYELELRSNPRALKQAIALGKTLSAQEDPFAVEIDVNRLNYRLKP